VPSILLVDDNSDDLLMIKRSLKKSIERVTTFEAFSAPLLEAAILQGGFDLVITDYHLGFTTGMDVLKRIKTHFPGCPVIMFTLTGNEEIAVQAMKSGMEDYILKTPQHLAQLSTTVTRVLLHQEERKTLAATRTALNESEWRYRSMFYSNHALMLFIDPKTMDIVDANPAACAFYGYSLEEFTKLKVSDTNALPVADLQQELEDAMSGKREFFVGQLRLKNNEIRDCEIYSGPVTVDGRPLLYSIIHDVTERRKAEAQLQLQAVVLESAANAIVITNKDGLIEWANPAFTNLTGYSLKESQNQELWFLDSGRQTPEFYDELRRTIMNAEVWQGQLTNRRKNNSEYIEEMTITPVKDETGQISHFVAIKQDVTEAVEYRRELELIQQVAWRLRETDDIQQLVDNLLSEVLLSLETDTGSIVMFDSVSKNLGISSSQGWFVNLPKPRKLPTDSVTARVVQTRISERIQNLHQNPNIYQKARDFIPNHWSGAVIPIQTGSDVLGVLNVAVAHPRIINYAEINMLERAAELAANTLRRLALRQQVQEQVRQLSLLHNIDLAITSSLDLDSVLKFFLQECVTKLGVDAAAVILHQPACNKLEFVATNGFKAEIQNLQLRLGEGRPGQAALGRDIVHISDFAKPSTENQPNFEIEGFRSSWSIPLWSRAGLQGVLELYTRTIKDFGEDWNTFLQSLAVQAAIAIENSRLFTDLQTANQDLQSAYDATIEALSLAIDLRDHETEGHSQRVTTLTVALAKELNLNLADVLQIRRGALLHDIGKLGVPDRILLKPGKLDAEEWGLMKQHPVLASEWLSKIPFLRPALEIPYAHHEKFDGTGYPRGLKGFEIPLAARIFAIIDVYDALMSDRPYRTAWTQEKTINYLLECSGTHFDPEITQAFVKLMRDSSQPHGVSRDASRPIELIPTT
jgi:PAS domain S-box-containing protein/putative nucleotidyltransferase with HDIG domain